MPRRSKSARKGQTQLSRSGKSMVSAQDAFSNPIFRLGYGSQSPLEATEYYTTRMTDRYALLNSLYRDNWVVQNVVGVIPDDMTKGWFTLTGPVAPEHMSEFERVQRETGLRECVNEGLRWGRLYGGAAGLIMIKGQEGLLDQPLELAMIMPGAFQGLYILDRWCGIVPDAEMTIERGKPVPVYYRINSPENRMVARVHRSRIIRFTGREMPFLERLAEVYWGESEVEALYQSVVRHDNVLENMAALTFRANLDTMEVANLEQLFSIGGGEQQRRFWNVMQAQSVMRSNFGMQLVNKGDQISNVQYKFEGLDKVYEAMCLGLSGASRIPMTKLFGRSPAGMNATGESDLQNYYDYVDNLRESKLRPIVEQLLPVLCMSAWGAAPEGLNISFPPLWTPTAKEVSEIAKSKAETVVSVFQAGLMCVDTAQKELKKLSDETGMFDSISDEEIAANAGKTYQDVTALRDPLMGVDFDAAEDKEESERSFERDTGDALTLDYPGQPRDKKGRFSYGKIGLTGGIGRGKLQSSQQIHLPDGSMSGLTSGTKITKVYTFAGKGTSKPIKDVSRLERTYNVPRESWKKSRGDGYVDMNGKSVHVELHWYESSQTGRVEMKVKRELK